MKKLFVTLLLCLLVVPSIQAQRAKIQIEGVSPYELTSLGLTTNSVSAGTRNVPNGTYAYFSAMNIADTNSVRTAVWTLTAKPTGSTAAIETFGSTWAMLKPDVKGQYDVKLVVTTATGTDDTTISVYSASYIGVGNFEGVAGSFPNCMMCHNSMPTFVAIFDKWKNSVHGQTFKKNATTGPASFGKNCFKCHTTGSDKNLVVNNGGFDDVATLLGYTWTSGPNAGKWDSLKTGFANLVNFATIGCESCHGPGSEHGTTGDKAKITVQYDDATCMQCHDSPWRYPQARQYKNSKHSVALWSGSFAQTAASQNNNLGNCIRCHDAAGFVNFTKGKTTNTTGWTAANHNNVTCATCHDPHGTGAEFSLRQTPTGSDTLGNGFRYTTFGGTGQLCMNCHKARRDGLSYQATPISGTWGPHHSVQSDIFLGQNAYPYPDVTYQTSNHKYAVTNACVDCHMAATTDTGTVNRDKVGGHSWAMANEATGYDHTKGCVSCHGPKTSFSDFVAAADYDQNGTIGSIQDEVKGLIRILKRLLPPVGQDTVIWSLIKGNADSVKYKQAFWNLQLVENDGSFGMHNAKYSLSVLMASIKKLNNGVIPVELMSFNSSINRNEVTLTWETATETNNKGFAVERNLSGKWVEVGFISGKGTTTEAQTYTYKEKLNLNSDAKVWYRLRQVDYSGKYTFSKDVYVSFVAGPQEYNLTQNYPNPFNPTTGFSFTVPVSGLVKVRVYDAMGNLVKELFNNTVEQGTYKVSWNADDANGRKVASGIYFYKLEAGSIVLTKKMVLMK